MKGILTAALLIVAAAVCAEPDPAGRPLPAGEVITNTSDSPWFVMLTVAPDSSFTNTTAVTLRQLDVADLRALADAMTDPRVTESEARIHRLMAEVAGADEKRDDLATRRDELEEESP